MIHVSCKNCNIVVNYDGKITLEQIKKCPPFHNFPKEPGECDHKWIIREEIKLGR